MVILLKSSSASLGSLALYRSSIQAVVDTTTRLIAAITMAFQAIFFMGAFCAAMKIEPRLKPAKEDEIKYRSFPRGLSIEARFVETEIWFLCTLID